MLRGVRAIEVGGHSPGQLMVEAEGGRLLFTSDAVHLHEELEHDRPFGVLADLGAMYGPSTGSATSPRPAPPSSPATLAAAHHRPATQRSGDRRTGSPSA